VLGIIGAIGFGFAWRTVPENACAVASATSPDIFVCHTFFLPMLGLDGLSTDYTGWAKYGTRPTSKGATEISEYFRAWGRKSYSEGGGRKQMLAISSGCGGSADPR
jgi:hypothetical protein